MASQQWKYDVFISFRGEDTRNNFLCHLNGALSRKGLETFVDDRLPRGEEINPALLQAIQDSKVAVIIFSKNYASSSWCLDELLKITECRETHSQIVIPVFYHVDPSDVRKQNGSFGESFKQHSENPRNDNKKIQEWKDALTKAANLSGWDSDAIRKDNELIDQIVEGILDELEPFYRCSLQGFVGLDRKISQVKTLLATRSSDVRILGIWGMGGIGKTTLAEAIFAQVSRQSEGRCFVKNVRESFEQRCEQRLLEQLFSELLQQSNVKIYTTNIGPDSRLVGWLKKKEVFVVFDDVSHRSQIEFLIGNPCWFRKGSIILITSRDKQVFEGITDNLYNVKALSYIESRQLFARNAFKQKHPSQDHILMDSFVNYAGGNPLAIKVLGSNVCGKGVELWKDAWSKLSNCPNQDIHNVLKLSYDGLDREEKAIFLHIACFFKDEQIYEAKRVLSSCRLSTNIGVSVLVDKSLVTISSHNRLDMHDLLQDMGREIVRQESSDPSQRSRLWDSEEIRNVLEKNKGTEAIESISLNMSQIEDIVLDPDVFKRMPNLKFLRFYTSRDERSKVHLTRGLHFLPNGLRYLYWYGYPLESLPTDLDAKELVVLHLPRSNIKQILKDGKDGGKLKVVAQSLIESPLMCRFTNIASGILPPVIGQFFNKITSLSMGSCQSLKTFPNNVDFPCLEILVVRGCSSLEILPAISTKLRKIDAGWTAIKEVHSSSIERLGKLEELRMDGCEKLESLPPNFCKLQALQELDLMCCSSLNKIPEIPEPMYDLRKLDLSYSGIEVIPSSMGNMKRLEELSLEECFNLVSLPEIISSQFLKVGGMRGNAHFEFSTVCQLRKKPLKPPHIFKGVECLTFSIRRFLDSGSLDATVAIHASDCNVDMTSVVSECVSYLIDLPSHPCLRYFSPYYTLGLDKGSIRELPKDLGSLYYLRRLNLSSNNFEEIPASIKQLSLLESLRLVDCPKLRSLQQLPTSLCLLAAARCKSLKTLLSFKQPIFNGSRMMFNFIDCLKLEKKECEAMAYKMLRNGRKDVSLCYPGSRITEWFRYQTTGDKISIKLPSNWFINRRFLGFAFCVVSGSKHMLMSVSSKYVEFECHFEDNNNPTIRFTYQTNFKLSGPSNCMVEERWYVKPESWRLMRRHVLVWCLHDFNVWVSERRQLFGRHCINTASFKFFVRERGRIKKCGITPLYMQGDEDDDEEDEYDHDENAYRMLQSLMSTNEDDDEDMNSGDADDMFSDDDEDLEDADDDMFW